MFYRRNWIAVMVIILGLFMFVPVAQAERQDYESIYCSATTYNVLQSSPELLIMSADQKGIIHQNKIKDFENTTWHNVGVVKMEGGKWSWNGFGKGMSPDGDFTIIEWHGDGESGTTAKFFYGTGKWKGIKGEIKGKMFTTGKPIVPGTNQYCEKYTGWIELPK
jgi:hypothetical protein